MQEKQMIECVPNFSEGRDLSIIKQIADVIANTHGVRLLHVDSGYAANRTVITFAGTPERVVEAAFLAIKKASELIDMSKQRGEHPRIGAADVCPLVPLANITMDEVVVFARNLSKRVAEELHIPVYCYEYAALHPARRNLAACRMGEYEGLKEKMQKAEWKPDFGTDKFNPKAGLTVIGARNYLVAYNINLNSNSAKSAKKIAADVRESGRWEMNADGDKIRIPGKLKSLKAIGWFIQEYGVAQISMNLTNLNITPIHLAYNEVCLSAQASGIGVTGSELVGLIPLQAMLDAGRYFLEKYNKPTDLTNEELVRIAVESLGLDDLKPFHPHQKIIEYVL